MNVIDQWERKAIRAIRKADEEYKTYQDSPSYQKAMAYCDCIQNFTYDATKWDCFDRLGKVARDYPDLSASDALTKAKLKELS